MRVIAYITALTLSCYTTYASAGCVLHHKAKQAAINVVDPTKAFPEFLDKLKKVLNISLLYNVRWNEGEQKHNFVFGCKFSYDLWQELYSIEVTRADQTVEKIQVKDLTTIPDACMTFALTGKFADSIPKIANLSSVLNPVSEEQIDRTRNWLAEHGFAGEKSGLVTRTVGAFTRLRAEKRIEDVCVVTRD